MDTLKEQYEALPRVGKWVVWFGGLVIIYFLIIDPAMMKMDNYRDAIGTNTSRIENYASPDKSAQLSIELGRKLWGDVLPPSKNDPHMASSEIRSILDKYHVTTGVSITENNPTTVRVGAGNQAGGAGGSDDSTTSYNVAPVDTRFTARPDLASKIIADIEKSPHITLISSVRIRRMPDQTALDVNIKTESWYQTQGGS